MKNLGHLFLIGSFIFVFLACSNDDDKEGINDELAMATGTYNLVELNINPAQDINNDGNTTSNVLTELPCTTGTLVLRSDSSWTWSVIETNVTSITGGAFHFSCNSDTTTRSGSWNIDNNQVTLLDGATSFIFTKDLERLTLTDGEDLPGFKSMVYER